MPVHDWTRADAGTFHAFHSDWITHLSEAMNDGLLPPGFFALPERAIADSVPDVVTLQRRSQGGRQAVDWRSAIRCQAVPYSLTPVSTCPRLWRRAIRRRG